MAGPMTKLMQGGAIPVDRLMECRLRWDLHKVMARTVEGFAPADLEPCATRRDQPVGLGDGEHRSEEHTSELQSLMRISYAVFCLKKKKKRDIQTQTQQKEQVPYLTQNTTSKTYTQPN